MNINQKIPTALPLLELFSKNIDFENSRPFEGYAILAVQHLLGSSIPLFEMLCRGGAYPEDIHIVGKAYSSHPAVVDRLIHQGYNLAFDEVFSYLSDKPYDSILEQHILTACKRMTRKSDDRGNKRNFLIIDDGGKALKLIQGLFTRYARFVGVEQTSRGARLLSELNLSFPVVNVARSEAKTIHESPMIAEAMIRELFASLDRWDANGVFRLKNRRVLLLGYGYIGEQVAKKFRNHGFHVVVYDTDGDKLAKAAQTQDISTVSRRTQAYPDVSLIVGCTGTPSIPGKEFKYIKQGSLLASMASTDTEFSASRWRRKNAIVHTSILSSDDQYLSQYFPLPWRSLYQCFAGDTHFFLANGGFPMDFSGSINPVPAENIQLTSTLLLAAAVQAVSTEQSGLIDLDHDMEATIMSEYLKLHSQAAETLFYGQRNSS